MIRLVGYSFRTSPFARYDGHSAVSAKLLVTLGAARKAGGQSQHLGYKRNLYKGQNVTFRQNSNSYYLQVLYPLRTEFRPSTGTGCWAGR